jgi:hypothetical protein
VPTWIVKRTDTYALLIEADEATDAVTIARGVAKSRWAPWIPHNAFSAERVVGTEVSPGVVERRLAPVRSEEKKP